MINMLNNIKSVLCILSLLILSLSFVSTPALAASEIPGKDIICGGACPLFDSEFEFTRDNIVVFIISFAQFLTFVGVGLTVLMIVWGGIRFIVGQGEQGQTTIRIAVI